MHFINKSKTTKIGCRKNVRNSIKIFNIIKHESLKRNESHERFQKTFTKLAEPFRSHVAGHSELQSTSNRRKD